MIAVWVGAAAAPDRRVAQRPDSSGAAGRSAGSELCFAWLEAPGADGVRRVLARRVVRLR